MFGMGMGITPGGRKYLAAPTNLHLTKVGSNIRATWTDAINAPNGYAVKLDRVQVDTVSQGVGTVNIPFNVEPDFILDPDDYANATAFFADPNVDNDIGGTATIDIMASPIPLPYGGTKAIRHGFHENPPSGNEQPAYTVNFGLLIGSTRKARGEVYVLWPSDWQIGADHKTMFVFTKQDSHGSLGRCRCSLSNNDTVGGPDGLGAPFLSAPDGNDVENIYKERGEIPAKGRGTQQGTNGHLDADVPNMRTFCWDYVWHKIEWYIDLDGGIMKWRLDNVLFGDSQGDIDFSIIPDFLTSYIDAFSISRNGDPIGGTAPRYHWSARVRVWVMTEDPWA